MKWSYTNPLRIFVVYFSENFNHPVPLWFLEPVVGCRKLICLAGGLKAGGLARGLEASELSPGCGGSPGNTHLFFPCSHLPHGQRARRICTKTYSLHNTERESSTCHVVILVVFSCNRILVWDEICNVSRNFARIWWKRNGKGTLVGISSKFGLCVLLIIILRWDACCRDSFSQKIQSSQWVDLQAQNGQK